MNWTKQKTYRFLLWTSPIVIVLIVILIDTIPGTITNYKLLRKMEFEYSSITHAPGSSAIEYRCEMYDGYGSSYGANAFVGELRKYVGQKEDIVAHYQKIALPYPNDRINIEFMDTVFYPVQTNFPPEWTKKDQGYYAIYLNGNGDTACLRFIESR